MKYLLLFTFFLCAEHCPAQVDRSDKQRLIITTDLGGLITALLESAFPNNLGFEVGTPDSAFDPTGVRPDSFWFGEAQSRVIVSVSEKSRADFWKVLEESDIPFVSLGKVTIGTLTVDGEPWGLIEDWRNLYDTAIEKHLTKELDSEGALAMI